MNKAAETDPVIADFEGDTYGEWTVEGAAFGNGPVREGVRPPNNPTIGHQGRGLVNTYLGGDGPVGKLTSPEFTIERNFINFLIGAGSHANETCMNLLINGKVVHSAVGAATKDDQGREILTWAAWDVSKQKGQKATLQIIVLFQKTTKDMMFSGGGFVDFNNSAGLGTNVLFAAFTSTGRGECLAYSTDNGLTMQELPENPVVRHSGRDPKVIWYAPEAKWVMAVYNTSPCAETEATPAIDENQHNTANVAFYESKNLRAWTRTGAFTDPDRSLCRRRPVL